MWLQPHFLLENYKFLIKIGWQFYIQVSRYSWVSIEKRRVLVYLKIANHYLQITRLVWICTANTKTAIKYLSYRNCSWGEIRRILLSDGINLPQEYTSSNGLTELTTSTSPISKNKLIMFLFFFFSLFLNLNIFNRFQLTQRRPNRIYVNVWYSDALMDLFLSSLKTGFQFGGKNTLDSSFDSSLFFRKL
jgi:hypothetical protein